MMGSIPGTEHVLLASRMIKPLFQLCLSCRDSLARNSKGSRIRWLFDVGLSVRTQNQLP
jgi:hypothetical protein